MVVYAVIRRCCDSGFCIDCHDLSKETGKSIPIKGEARTLVIQTISQDKKYADKVAVNWKGYGDGYGSFVEEVTEETFKKVQPKSAAWLKQKLENPLTIHPYP